MPDMSFTPKDTTCCLCHKAASQYDWNAVLLAPVCQDCRTVFGYGTPNDRIIGPPLKRFPSFSLEFEVEANRHIPSWELDRALVLVKHHFKRTHDSSVDYEYKSPIYRNIRSVRKALAVMDTLADLVSDHCGTHLHIACCHKNLLLPVLGDVFSPLLTHMLHDPEETTRFWGRYFNCYATPVNRDRYHCFNLEGSHPTVEFRLPRFRTAEQYLRVIKFARACMAYLNGILAMTSVAQTQCAQAVHPAPAIVGVAQWPAGVLGWHVMKLYRAHVARMKSKASWFTRLSPKEQLQVQTFHSSSAERPAPIEFNDEDDEDDDDEEETDDWLR